MSSVTQTRYMGIAYAVPDDIGLVIRISQVRTLLQSSSVVVRFQRNQNAVYVSPRQLNADLVWPVYVLDSI